jgi:Uma2 family endonuclease
MPSCSGTFDAPRPGKEKGMTTLDVPRLPLTAEEFERMPPVKGLRIELWEGNLDVSAAAQMRWHAVVMRRIANLFEAAGRAVTTETGVVLARRTVREPDVTRFRAGVNPGYKRSQFPAADVDCVVEVVSAESGTRDRKLKPDEYASAGIPEFWLVEEHPDEDADAVINIYRLTPHGNYAFERSVDLSALLAENPG